MVTLNTQVNTRPEFDMPTKMASYWIGKMLEYLHRKGVMVNDLADGRANYKELLATLDREDPAIFWGMGHGSEDVFTGQDHEILFQVGVNLDLLEGRIVHLTSCLTGVKLAPAMVKAGVVAVFAYTYDLIIGLEVEPFPESKITQSLMEPDTEIEKAMADGLSTAQAYEASEHKTEEWLDYWVNSGDPNTDVIMLSIISNRNARILLGVNTRGVLEAPPISILGVATTLVVAFVTGIGLLGGKKS